MTMIINPGKLKHRFIVYSQTKGKDTQGFKSSLLLEILRAKCDMTEIEYTDITSGSGAIDAKEKRFNCTMRYSNLINEDCIFEIYGTKYKIEKMSNVNMENRFLKLVLVNV